MAMKQFKRWVGSAGALYFIGSAVVAQAQTAEPLPFVPVLMIGQTNLQNDQVIANADGSYSMLGQEQGGSYQGGFVWDLSWDLTLNQDPSIAGTVTLTNLTNITRNFNLAFGLPINPAFPTSLFGGNLTATLLDRNGDLSATLSPIAISPSIYRGTIDGVTVLSLFGADMTCVGSNPGCTATLSDSLGLPGPTLPGPAVNSTIGIFLNFSLSAGDRVTFATNFTVEPPAAVPLPAGLPLLVMGLGSLALGRRATKTKKA